MDDSNVFKVTKHLADGHVVPYSMQSAPRIPKDWATLVRGRTAGGAQQEDAPPVAPSNETPGGGAQPQPVKPSKRKRGGAAHVSAPPQTVGGASSSSSATQHPTGSGFVESMQDACSNILSAISRHRPRCDDADNDDDDVGDLNMDHIMCRVATYKGMLQDLFSDESVKPPDVPVVTKSYEESYMREPNDPVERHCVMGEDCECNFITKGEGFVGVEFVLPGQEPTETPQMCVLCHRRSVQSLFYDMVYSGLPYRGVIQRYGNICGQDGEYARDSVLVCPPNGPVECMPYPMASHQRNRYAVVAHHGVKFVRQNGMGHQDFDLAPSAAQH